MMLVHKLFFLQVLLLYRNVSLRLIAHGLTIASPKNKNKIYNAMNAKISKAIELTKLSESNITSAKYACELWNIILNESNDNGMINNQVRVLSHALYASCLTRIGKEVEAINEYGISLSLSSYSNEKMSDNEKSQRVDWVISIAKAYQRLLQYSNAKNEFLKAVKMNDDLDDRGLIGAITCSLRLGDINEAFNIIQHYYVTNNRKYVSKEVLGILGTLQYLTNENCTNNTLSSLLTASKDNLLLYQWIHDSVINSIDQQKRSNWNNTMIYENVKKNLRERYLDLIKINTSPFDEHTLIYLDDKVHLHRLLINGNLNGINTNQFWPFGHIIADQNQYNLLFQNSNNYNNSNDNISTLWMLKQRSGYGSHGNKILSLSKELVQNITTANDIEYSGTFRKMNKDEQSHEKFNAHLLQKMIHPSFLINNCKFSLRVYVIYFSIHDIYISTQGLVKLASAAFKEKSDLFGFETEQQEQSLFMTNSGREMNMMQKDFHFLKHVFRSNSDGNDNSSYDLFWGEIKSSVRSVFQCYNRIILSQEHCNQQDQVLNGNISEHKNLIAAKKQEMLCIPKIMGFDYVVDALKKPWLVEVNRFPGLEPRDNSDKEVKLKVVLDAWVCANMIRQKISRLHAQVDGEDDIASCVDDDHCFTSLEKL